MHNLPSTHRSRQRHYGISDGTSAAFLPPWALELGESLMRVIVKQRAGIFAGGEKRYLLRYWFDGKRWEIFSDRQGIPLASQVQAIKLASLIEDELNETPCTHAPRKYQPFSKNDWAFNRLARKWLDAKKKDVVGATWAKYEMYMRLHIIPHFTDRDITTIRKPHLTEFKNSLPATHSAKTTHHLLATLRGFMNWCVENEILVRVPPFPCIKVPSRQPKWADQTTQFRVLEHVEPAYHRDFVLFNILHGFRPGESCALNVGNVNLATGKIRLYHSKTKNEHEVGIHPWAVDLLKERIASRLPGAALFTFFCERYKNTKAERRYTLGRLYKITATAMAKAGIKMTVYEFFKHSKMTQMANAGASPFMMQAYAGWSSAQMANKYVGLDGIAMQLVHPIAPVIPIGGAGLGLDGKTKKYEIKKQAVK